MIGSLVRNTHDLLSRQLFSLFRSYCCYCRSVYGRFISKGVHCITLIFFPPHMYEYCHQLHRCTKVCTVKKCVNYCTAILGLCSPDAFVYSTVTSHFITKSVDDFLLPVFTFLYLSCDDIGWKIGQLDVVPFWSTVTYQRLLGYFLSCPFRNRGWFLHQYLMGVW